MRISTVLLVLCSSLFFISTVPVADSFVQPQLRADRGWGGIGHSPVFDNGQSQPGGYGGGGYGGGGYGGGGYGGGYVMLMLI